MVPNDKVPLVDEVLAEAKREGQERSRALVRSRERKPESMFLVAPEIAKNLRIRHRTIEWNDKEVNTITIMPDAGGAYAWRAVPGSDGIGTNVAGFGGWGVTDLPISDELATAFADWQSQFEDHARSSVDPVPGDRYASFDWPAFHARGIELASRLKAELGDAARVVYEKPFEDHGRTSGERTEMCGNGWLKPQTARETTKND